jgi:hypothetical protein
MAAYDSIVVENYATSHKGMDSKPDKLIEFHQLTLILLAALGSGVKEASK